jgi:hypothetical protein
MMDLMGRSYRNGEELVKIQFITLLFRQTAWLFCIYCLNRFWSRRKVIKMAGVKSTESSEFLTKIILESGNYTFNIH